MLAFLDRLLGLVVLASVIVVTIALGGCGAEPVETVGDVERLMAAPGRLEEAATLRFEEHRVSNVGRAHEEWLVEGEVDLVGELARYRRTNDPDVDGVGAAILQAGGALYAASPDPECRPWLKIEEGVAFPPIHPVWLLESAEQMHVEHVGIDTVAGVETQHYRLEVAPDVYREMARSAGSLEPTGPVQLEAWLDDDGWVRQFSRVLTFMHGQKDGVGEASTEGPTDDQYATASGEGPQLDGTVSVVWRLWDFGEPLDIRPPAHGEVGTEDRLGPDPLRACDS